MARAPFPSPSQLPLDKLFGQHCAAPVRQARPWCPAERSPGCTQALGTAGRELRRCILKAEVTRQSGDSNKRSKKRRRSSAARRTLASNACAEAHAAVKRRGCGSQVVASVLELAKASGQLPATAGVALGASAERAAIATR